VYHSLEHLIIPYHWLKVDNLLRLNLTGIPFAEGENFEIGDWYITRKNYST